MGAAGEDVSRPGREAGRHAARATVSRISRGARHSKPHMWKETRRERWRRLWLRGRRRPATRCQERPRRQPANPHSEGPVLGVTRGDQLDCDDMEGTDPPAGEAMPLRDIGRALDLLVTAVKQRGEYSVDPPVPHLIKRARARPVEGRDALWATRCRWHRSAMTTSKWLATVACAGSTLTAACPSGLSSGRSSCSTRPSAPRTGATPGATRSTTQPTSRCDSSACCPTRPSRQHHPGKPLARQALIHKAVTAIPQSSQSASYQMRIPARDLTIGDVLLVNDWQLHVTAVEHEMATAILTSEFKFLLHFMRDDLVDVVGDVQERPLAP